MPPEDPAKLAEAVVKLYQDAPLREDLGRNGRRYIVENLSREHLSHTYIASLEEIVRNKKNR